MCRRATVKISCSIRFDGFSMISLLGGKCGICGDAFSSSRDHEIGGKYATNIIVREYLQGASIDVKILVRYFCFSLTKISE